MRDLLPNGMLGVAIAGLLAAFMAGMAANISSFNTVFTYDIWQPYIRKNRPDATTCGSVAPSRSSAASWPSRPRSSPVATAT